MLDARMILRAGGFVPPDRPAPEDERTGVVQGRRYTHPALPGRTVVRLVAEAMAPGADVEMDTLGFDAPTATPPLGRQRYRTLGFPGWALVNDPKRAKFALEVMKDFKRAAARIRSKPGNARDAFVAIAERLGRSVPHFLPSFWEEAGRAFIAEESTAYAAQFFEKARQAEQEHALAIDEDTRAAAFLEFSLAGAIGMKTLAAYAKELERARGAAEAYPRFAELAVRRTLGGMPPWSSMPRDLRVLAKAAEIDADAEDERVLGELLEAPSLARAPVEFWTAYRPALVRMAKRSDAVRARIANLFPRPGSSDFSGWWLDLLNEAGVVDALASGGAPGEAAAWMGKVLDFARSGARPVEVLERLAPRMIADGVPLQVVQGKLWGARANVDVCERALELGVKLADPPANPADRGACRRATPFDLTRGFACDPVRVAADPRFGPLLASAVSNAIGQGAFEVAARGKKGVAAARAAWMDALVAGLAGPFAAIEASLPSLRQRTSAPTFAEFPAARDRLLALTFDDALAGLLRGGVADEFGWPALEDAVRDLGGPKGCVLQGVTPYPAVWSATKAIVLGAAGRVLEHDLRVPPNATLRAVRFVGGQALVVFLDRGAGVVRAYWTGAPAEVFPVSPELFRDVSTMLDLPGGAATFGGRKVTPGDTAFGEVGSLVSDGQGIWSVEFVEDGLRLRELDPQTGARGRASWPTVVERSLAPGDVVTEIRLVPGHVAAGAPVSTKEGLVGAWTVKNGGGLACIGVDGRRVARTDGARPHASPVRFPGDDTPRLAIEEGTLGRATTKLFDAEGNLLHQLGRAELSRGWPLGINLRFWSFLSPRDEAGSRALRALDRARAARLLAAARADRGRSDPTLAETRRALADALPEVTHAALREGIAGIVDHVAKLADEVERLARERAAAPAVGAPAPRVEPLASKELAEALPLFFGRVYQDGDLGPEIAAAAAWLHGGGAQPFGPSPLGWEALLGCHRALALLATSPVTPAPARAVLGRALGILGALGLARGLERVRIVRARVHKDAKVVRADASRGAWLAEDGASRYFVRGGGPDATPDHVLVHLVERAADGAFRLPPEARILGETRFAPGDDTRWIEDFVAEIGARGVPGWDEGAPAEVERRTGMSRAEATLLLAGLPSLQTRVHDFLGKERRATLGIKIPDAAAAADTLRKIDAPTLRGLLARAAPEDPRAFWTAATPEDEAGTAARLAAAWTATRGKAAAVRQELVVACKEDLDLTLSPAAALRAIVDPEGAACMKVVAAAPAEILAGDRAAGATERFGTATVHAVALLARYLFVALPVGDPYRSAVPKACAAVRARLGDPKALLYFGTGLADAVRAPVNAVLDALSGTAEELPADPKAEYGRDVGLLTVRGNRWSVGAAFRPALVGSSPAAVHALDALAKVLNTTGGAYDAVRFLASPECAALTARIESTPVPEGQWEGNALLSAPATVARAREALGVSEEAALLYLQLLTLAEPSSKKVQTYNGWKAADVKAAGAELAAKKLVVEGKRERAGRDFFLPGAWDKAGAVEPWKAKHLSVAGVVSKGTAWPGLPLHALFERAWKRVEDGDRPAFEEV